MHRQQLCCCMADCFFAMQMEEAAIHLADCLLLCRNKKNHGLLARDFFLRGIEQELIACPIDELEEREVGMEPCHQRACKQP